jgi:hypothetical protein
MYNLEQFHFVEVKEYKNDEIVCLIEHEDSKELLEFIVDHGNIEDYYEALGVDLTKFKLQRIQDDYEDICSNLFIDLKESENSESINGLHVRAVKKVKRPFWEFVIDNINSSFIPRKSTDTEAFLLAYQRKVKAVEYKAVFL